MSYRFLTSMGVLATVIAVVSLAPAPVGGQALTATADTWTPRRTPWGEPNLQGIWDFRTITPLERPSKLTGKEFLTEEEADELEEQTAQSRVDRAPRQGSVGSYNQFWFDRGTTVIPTRRTSLIIDPPDGRIPGLTPQAQKRADARQAVRERPAHSPEDRAVAERCILGFNAGPPMNPGAYNNNVHLFQTPGYVALFIEMVHDARIVPLDGRPHLPENIRQWRGDSRGHWEGDTLVVETTNFTNKTSFRGSGKDLHLVERFTRVDADTLLYEYTINDPKSFTRPWTAAVPMKKTEQPMFEYACHEGNYSMTVLLEGARAEEQAAEEAAKKSR